MKHKIFLLITGMIVFWDMSSAQTMYELSIRLPKQPPSITITAFLVRLGDEGNYVRIHQNNNADNTSSITEIALAEEPYRNPKGMIDENLLVLKTTGLQKSISGTGPIMTTIAFLFRKDKASGYFDPWKMATYPASGNLQLFDFATPPTLMQEKQLTANTAFLTKYFTEGEPFYTAYSKPASRGGMSWGTKIPTLFIRIVADINDAEIGRDCREDQRKLIKLYTLISQKLRIRLDTLTLMGKDFNREKIEKSLADLHPGKNDMVVFHYSGHGFNRDDPEDTYPNLFLVPDTAKKSWKKAQLPGYTLSIQDIYSTIVSKGARLNLVISDCCNTIISLKNIVSEPIKKSRGLFTLYPDYCKVLFIDQSVSLLANATTKGEQSRSNPTDGGYFTYNYVQQLSKYLTPAYNPGNTELTWDALFKTAREGTIQKTNQCIDRTTKARCIMSPIFKIEKPLVAPQ